MRILPEGRLYFERAAAEKKDEQRRNRMEALCAFFGALLGAALSGGIVALIVLL